MSERTSDDTLRAVRDHYGAIAESTPQTPCCGTGEAACCGPDALGYTQTDIEAIPESARMSLGCGNPTAIATLKPGETVLDLGSGGGFDCFVAAQAVGPTGRVIGVDMTPPMIERARKSAREGSHDNVEFRLGEIEHVPVADATVDVIMSNCVINLAPDKRAVYEDAFRALRPDGRIAISDVVRTGPLPEDVLGSEEFLTGCVSGSLDVDELRSILDEVGFADVSIEPVPGSREFIREWAPDSGIEDLVMSAMISAVKPA